MFILMIIGMLGLIFSLCIILSLILYFTSKGIIGDPKGYDKLEGVDMLDELDASISDKETQKGKSNSNE